MSGSAMDYTPAPGSGDVVNKRCCYELYSYTFWGYCSKQVVLLCGCAVVNNGAAIDYTPALGEGAVVNKWTFMVLQFVQSIIKYIAITMEVLTWTIPQHLVGVLQ